ncbi:MAG: DPP IV N-terminal domain-containing protein, partial [Rhodothermales bacterium]
VAEATAQYQREFMSYDSWDTHRDMLLRTRVLAGEELSLAEMGSFYSHSSLLRESVYNHGFAFTHYLANTYGEDVLPKLSRDLGKWSNWNVERALKDATGESAGTVYGNWVAILRAEYAERTASIRENPVEGRLIEKDGFSNFYPRFSPDGRRLAYVSNRGEHFNVMSLYVVDLESGEKLSFDFEGMSGGAQLYTCSLGHQHRVRGGVGGAVTWHPSGESIVYAKTKDTPEGFRYSDLYTFDLTTKKEKRLTKNARALAPAYSPDGASIAFVSQKDGTADLYLLDVDSGAIRRITDYGGGAQVSEPAWHPDGEHIYYGLSSGGGRSLVRIPMAGADEHDAAHSFSGADWRSPAISPDGRYLYFS